MQEAWGGGWPLHMAVRAGSLACVEVLLDYGADVELGDYQV